MYKKAFFALFFTLCAWVCTYSGHACAQPAHVHDTVAIEGARLSTSPEKTRFVLELSAATPFTLSKLSQPERLVIDIPKAHLDTDLKDSVLTSKLIADIRTAKHTEYVRVVIELTQAVTEKHFVLKPDGQYGDRLVIDLFPTHASAPTTVTKAPFVPQIIPLTQPVQKPVVEASKKTISDEIVVVIDPGHGGKDSGALGPRGTKEKFVVLNIARKLKRHLDEQPGIRAVLTRDGDYYITLRERLNRAREQKADVFISVHADAFNNPKSHGASVYALSASGASSEAARWLAAKENYSELGDVKLDDKEDIVRQVLINLSQRVSITHSLALGESILKSLSPMAKLHHNNVEQAQFVVLKSPDIPSVLLETGFISNPQEERLLSDPQYQDKLAKAVWAGLRYHFLESPPEGTFLAVARQRGQTHTVQKGENLAVIAKRYGTSVEAIKKANLLSSNTLQLDQALQVPSQHIG